MLYLRLSIAWELLMRDACAVGVQQRGSHMFKGGILRLCIYEFAMGDPWVLMTDPRLHIMQRLCENWRGPFWITICAQT